MRRTHVGDRLAASHTLPRSVSMIKSPPLLAEADAVCTCDDATDRLFARR
jgi:hypothetical protein